MKERVAVVVGGGSGMGRASAERLASEGARVVVADIDAEAAEKVMLAINHSGGDSVAAPVDVSDPISTKGLLEFTLSTCGQVDALVSTAGIAANRSPVVDLTDDDWRRVVGINLDGTFHLARSFGREMMEQRSGTMVFIASDRGLYGQRHGAAYASSKAGVIAFVKSLALELGEHGVTVNAINPGTTDTRLTRSAEAEELRRRRMAEDPLGRLSQPEDIAEIVLFLAKTAGRFMTGQLITTRMRFG